MTCKHTLGVWAECDGTIVFEYENIGELSEDVIFKFCPECGANLRCDHVFEPILASYNEIYKTYRARCVKCNFEPN